MIIHQKNSPMKAAETLILPHNIPVLSNSPFKGDVTYQQGDTHFEFVNIDSSTKRVKVSFPSLAIEAEFEFKRNPNDEVLTLFDPLNEDASRWFVTEKIPYVVNGSIKFDSKVQVLKNATGMMDWGRGLWTYQTEWIWANAVGWKNQNRVGINLGSLQRGSNSLASEDCIFYNERVIKLGTMKVELDRTDLLKPWKIISINSEPRSSYGYAEVSFIPEVVHPVRTNLLIAKVELFNVYGVFQVKAMFEGKELEFEVRGFAEVASHRW